MTNRLCYRLSYLMAVISLAVTLSLTGVIADTYMPVDMGMSANAAEDDEEDGPRQPPSARRAQTLSTSVYPRIEKVQEALQEDDFETAYEELAKVRDLRERGRLKPYDEYMMLQFYTQVANAQDDLDSAIEYTLDALTVEELLPSQYGTLNLRMAGFSLQKENYADAIEYFKKHLELDDDPDVKVYLHIAYAHYSIEDYAGALPWALDYINLSREQGEEVDMQGYRLTKSIYLLLERYEEARQLSRELIVMYDLPVDWVDYYQVSGAMDNFDENLQVLFVSELKGYLDKESQYVTLASQLFSRDNTYEAAMILEEALANGLIEEADDIYSFLSSCYQQAREIELAIAPLERAIELAGGDGEYYRRLGVLHYQLEQYEEAIAAFDNAYQSGEIENPSNMLLFMADAYSRIKQYDEAIEYAREAGRVDSEQSDASGSRARLYGQLRDKYLEEQRKRTEWAEFFR